MLWLYSHFKDYIFFTFKWNMTVFMSVRSYLTETDISVKHILTSAFSEPKIMVYLSYYFSKKCNSCISNQHLKFIFTLVSYTHFIYFYYN